MCLWWEVGVIYQFVTSILKQYDTPLQFHLSAFREADWLVAFREIHPFISHAGFTRASCIGNKGLAVCTEVYCEYFVSAEGSVEET